MQSYHLGSLRARLLTTSSNPRETTRDGQTLVNGFFRSLEVDDVPAVVLANDGSSLVNRGLVTTNNAPSAVQAVGENVDVVNFHSAKIEANNGLDVQATGVQVEGDASIRNAGKITGDFNGVQFAGPDSSGSLTNFRGGVISSDSRAVDIQGQHIEIRNSGQILGTGDQRNGTVYANGTADDYRIVNERSGVIDAGEGNNGSGISLQTGSVDGDVVDASVINRGVIRGRGDLEGENGELVGHGIRVFSGLTPNENGDLDGTTIFRGNIVNQGEITADEGAGLANGVTIEGGVLFLGDIVNQGLIDSADAHAIEIGPRGSFAGEIRNDGTLRADYDGILLNGRTVFDGNIVNNGRIEVGDEGIDVGTNNVFSGNIVNRGSIVAEDEGIEVSRDATFTGNVDNRGSIEAQNAGINVLINASFTGDIVNNGRIAVVNQDDESSQEIGILLDRVSDFTGNIVNQRHGRIEVRDEGIVVDSQVFIGDVVNQGRIDVGADAIVVGAEGNTFLGDIRNEGSISADSDGIVVDSGATFSGSVVNERGATIEAVGDGIEINNVDSFTGFIRNDGVLTGDAEGDGVANAIDARNAQVDIAVSNEGTINGDVALGSGNDVFFSSRGIVNGQVSGGQGNDVLVGGLSDDLLDGGSGDDLLIGGEGADTFIFEDDAGNDRVDDFEIGFDRLDVGDFFDSGSDALVAARQDGNDTVIDFSTEESVRLTGINSANLTENDFLI